MTSATTVLDVSGADPPFANSRRGSGGDVRLCKKQENNACEQITDVDNGSSDIQSFISVIGGGEEETKILCSQVFAPAISSAPQSTCGS